MAYVSLYRKYRPQTFDDVVGQDHVTRTLRNAIEEQRLSHAYLFTGPRGTGKTSTARILAKAINCEAGPTPRPCGACTQCEAITAGTSVDVIELDMASHGGVDDARELRDRALFAPASARRKVYILDEVHMASTAAFNALLKLIEEPPAHVLFAMATTDPQKVLPTIMSRVQRLDLRRVAAASVAAHVRELCAAEGYTIEDGALEAVVRAGDGSVRDTLSVLEQVLAYAGQEVTTEAVAQTLGTTPTERVIEAVDLVGARDLAGLLALVQDLVDDGHDLRRFTLDLVQHLRDLLVLDVAPDRPDLVDATDERRRRLQAQTSVLPRASLLRAVDLLATTVAEQRQGTPRLPLELALATLAVPGAGGDLAELSDRVARLEAGAPPTGARAAGLGTSGAAVSGGDRSAGDLAPAEARQTGSPTVTDPASPMSPEDLVGVDAADVPAPSEQADGDVEVPAPSEQADGDVEVPASSEQADGDADVPAPSEQADPEASSGEATGADPDDEPSAVSASAEAPGVQDAVPAPPDPVAADARDELATIEAHWEEILERVRQGSKRHHAMFLPAVPVAAGRGILTLRYGTRYASFHAEQARTGELDAAMRTAIEQACGMRVKLDIVIEGEDHRRRPQPPSVTPDDARTPKLDDDAATGSGRSDAAGVRGVAGGDAAARAEARARAAQAAAAAQGATDGARPRDVADAPPTPPPPGDEDDEGSAVREAEAGVSTPTPDVDELLRRELGASLIEELPPPGAEQP